MDASRDPSDGSSCLQVGTGLKFRPPTADLRSVLTLALLALAVFVVCVCVGALAVARAAGSADRATYEFDEGSEPAAPDIATRERQVTTSGGHHERSGSRL